LADGDFARQLAEQLGLLSVLPPLAVHDVLELGMAGHARSLGIRPERRRKARRYKPQARQNQRLAALFGMTVGLTA
jgi:hypothetical protein